LSNYLIPACGPARSLESPFGSHQKKYKMDSLKISSQMRPFVLDILEDCKSSEELFTVDHSGYNYPYPA
jgi:hypothetical protein